MMYDYDCVRKLDLPALQQKHVALYRVTLGREI